MNKKFEPFLAHSELTDCIYIIDKDDKHEVTEQCIKAMKATNRMPRWTPVSEGLPEKEMNCLVTDSLGKVHKVTFYHALDGRGSYFSGCYCVKAWMPLPEPYKAESEE